MSTQSAEEESSSAHMQVWIDQGGTCQDRIEVGLEGSLVVQKLFYLMLFFQNWVTQISVMIHSIYKILMH